MKQTPWISFNNATQVQTKSAADLKPGAELALIQNFFVAESDTAPTFPWPSDARTFSQTTLHGSPPDTTGLSFGGTIIDWFQVGGYTVLLGSSRTIIWCAPERPTVWTLNETVGGVTVKTGAGSEVVAGTGEFKWGIQVGETAVIFDEEGIGMLSLSGDWTSPFAYSKNIGNLAAYSWPVQFGNAIYFIDKGGKLFSLAWGSYAQEVQGPFNLHLALGSSWSTSFAELPMQFLEAEHRLSVYVPGAGGFFFAMIDFRAGGFSVYDTTNYSMIRTGGIVLPDIDPGERTHVMRVDLKIKLQSVSTAGWGIQIRTADVYDQTFVTGETVSLPAATGEYILQFIVDQTVSHIPMFEFLPAGANVVPWLVGGTYASGTMVVYQSGLYASLHDANTGNYPPSTNIWDYFTTYALHDTVQYGSVNYLSIQATNLAHPPVVTDTWNTAISYIAGQAAIKSAVKYISLLDNNLNNDPASGAPWWATYDPTDWWTSYDPTSWWSAPGGALKFSLEGMRIMYDKGGLRAGKD